MKKALECLLVWLAIWVCLHEAHWMLVHYFVSVLPAALAPASWTGDGIDAFFIKVFMSLQDYMHKATEKWQKPTPARSSSTLPKREGEE